MKNNRFYGIDLLRIILMILIVMGHLFTHTNIRNELSNFTPKWFITWGLQTVIVSAVNCFVLITGYFTSNSNKFYFKKIVQTYGKVLYYSVLIFCLLILFDVVDFEWLGLINAIFPVLTGQYWYFSTYILLLLLVPFIKILLDRLNDYMLKILLAIIIFIFYVVPLFSILFVQFDASEGMGIIGFVSLFIIGYSLKRLNISFSRMFCVIGLIINSGFIFLSKIGLTIIIEYLGLEVGSSLLYHYNTIFTLINAILLLLLFKQVNFNVRIAKLITNVNVSVFSVYLIHENPYIRKLIWSDSLCGKMINMNLINYVTIIILIPIIIFIVCLIIDKIRLLVCNLFYKTKMFRKLDTILTNIDENLKNKF